MENFEVILTQTATDGTKYITIATGTGTGDVKTYVQDKDGTIIKE